MGLGPIYMRPLVGPPSDPYIEYYVHHEHEPTIQKIEGSIWGDVDSFIIPG